MAIQPMTHAALANAFTPSISPARQIAGPGPNSAVTSDDKHAVTAIRDPKEIADGDVKSSTSSPGRTELEDAITKVQKAVEPVARALQFSIDDATGKAIVKVVDSNTDEVIRQIPSEELLSIARALDKLQGLLVKQEV